MRFLPSIPPVKLLGKEIKPATVTKDLAVMIDSFLSFNEHVTKTVSNCMYRLIRIIEISTYLIKKNATYTYWRFCFSKLFCCRTVWSNTSKANVKRLKLVQNFTGRIALGLRKYDHVSDSLKLTDLYFLAVNFISFLFACKVLHFILLSYLAILIYCGWASVCIYVQQRLN